MESKSAWIREDQIDWIENKNINFSKFIRKIIDEEMNKDD